MKNNEEKIFTNEFLFKGTTELKLPEEEKYREAYKSIFPLDQNIDEISDKQWKECFYSKLKDQLNGYLPKNFENVILFLGAGASVKGENWKYGKTMGQIACLILGMLYIRDFDDKNPKKFLLTKTNKTDSKDTDKENKNWNLSPQKEYILTPNEFENIAGLKRGDLCKFLKKGLLGKGPSINFSLEDFISVLDEMVDLIGNQSAFLTDADKSLLERAKATDIFIKEKIIKYVQYKNIKFNNEDGFSHLATIKDIIAKKQGHSKLNVITTNYDMLVEKAAETGNIVVFDGFSFSPEAAFDDSLFDWNLTKQIEGMNTKEISYNSNVINLLKIHGSINWINKNNKVRRISKYANVRKSNERVMIFPSSNKYKQSYDKPYFELLSRFQNLLHKENTLLITAGFSFADDHISRMILDSLKNKQGLKILVTDYSIAPKNKNWKELDEMRKNSFPVVFLKATMNGKEHNLDYYLR